MFTHYLHSYGKDNSKKLYANLGGKKYRIGNVCSSIENKGYFCQCMWMTSTLLERSRIWHPCGNIMKNADIDEHTSFLDHGYLGCTQRECKPNETIIEQIKKMFESRYSAGATEKIPVCESFHVQTVAWSYDQKGHAQKCVERYCDLANEKVEQLYIKFQILAWMIINSSRKKSNQLENCQEFALKLSRNACTWNELDDLTFYGQQACKISPKMDSGM